jgi:hypothetical protein
MTLGVDTQHNSTQFKDTQRIDAQTRGTQHINTQFKNSQYCDLKRTSSQHRDPWHSLRQQ